MWVLWRSIYWYAKNTYNSEQVRKSWRDIVHWAQIWGFYGDEDFYYGFVAYDALYQLLVYVDDDNVLGGKTRAVKKYTDTLIVTTKETGLQVNTDTTKCIVLPRDQNARRIYIVKIDDNSWKGGKVKILGNKLNKSEFYSGRSEEQVKVRE